MNSYPEEYPEKLIPYSWNFNERAGILNYWNKYCVNSNKDSIYFVKNYLKSFFLDKAGLKYISKDIQEYISFLNKCFTVCWNNEEATFYISMKRDKKDNKQTVFNKE